MIILIAVAAVVFTLLGGLTAVYFKDRLHLVLGFAAGAVFAVAFCCLLPEALEIGEKIYSPNIIFFCLIGGFLTYLIFDRIFPCHSHEHNQHDCENPGHANKFGVLALIFHSVLDGIGLGVALHCNVVIGGIVILAILLHKYADGLSVVGIIFGKNGKNEEAFRYLLIAALAPTIGIIFSSFIVVPVSVLCIIMAIMAGIFLYLSASDLLIEAYHCHNSAGTTLATILGVTSIYIAIQVAHQFV